MRKPVIAGNWKMYKTVDQSVATALELKPLVANATHCDVVLGAVFTGRTTIADRLEGSNIKVAAQNCATERGEGAFTGEVAAFMVRDAGCSHVIVGHSERRQSYLENDHLVSRKAQAGIAAGLSVIVCIGETLEQRDRGKAQDVVSEQLIGSLSGLTASDLDRIIVAYEPVWAIGTGRTATPEQAQVMQAFIRRVFAERHGQAAADALRILYGGSVKPANIADLMKQSDIDGALVGGASLNAESFAQIVNYR